MKLRRKSEPRPEIPLAPMIDCVFLLMVYFIVTVTVQTRELQIPFQLPGGASLAQVDFADEQWIAIHDNGEIWWNGYCYGNAAEYPNLEELRAALAGLQAIHHLSESSSAITLVPDDQVRHQWVVSIMDMIQSAGIQSIYFGAPGDLP